jgi:hypothetical protein
MKVSKFVHFWESKGFRAKGSSFAYTCHVFVYSGQTLVFTNKEIERLSVEDLDILYTTYELKRLFMS